MSGLENKPLENFQLEVGIVPSKVLIVDDDVETTELMKILLEPNAFEVAVANSVQDGMEKVNSLKPDVMIVDLMMPNMDGWQVCREVRKFSRVPILVLSVVNSPEMVAKALDAGADEYLVKPVTCSVLIAHLRRLARRAKLERGGNFSKPALGYSA